MTPAVRPVTAATCAGAEHVARDILRAAEDERVQDDDVRHRDEGDDAAADLAAERRAALRDLEEPVEPVLRRVASTVVVVPVASGGRVSALRENGG